MDDADDELTRLAIRQAFEATDQYGEIVPTADAVRVAQLWSSPSPPPYATKACSLDDNVRSAMHSEI